MFNNIFLVLTISIAFMSCEKSKNLSTLNCVMSPSVQNGVCIDSTLIGNSDECIEIYDPVCGCNEITYSNTCYAAANGVLTWEKGECFNWLLA